MQVKIFDKEVDDLFTSQNTSDKEYLFDKYEQYSSNFNQNSIMVSFVTFTEYPNLKNNTVKRPKYEALSLFISHERDEIKDFINLQIDNWHLNNNSNLYLYEFEDYNEAFDFCKLFQES